VSARIGVGGTFSVGVVAPSAFVFVEERNFLEPIRPTTVVFNETIVNKTVNITKIQVVNKTVVNIGPRVEVIQRATGRQIQTVPVNQLRRKQETDVVAKQPQVKALHQARAHKPVQGQATSEPEHHTVPPAETDEERQQKAQRAEKQREQNAEREQAEKEKREQATEQGREQKTQDVGKQQEQKEGPTGAQKDEQAQKQKQQEKRKAAEKAAAQKKKAQEEENRRAKEQPAQ
jgi:colicin import membrane protein